MWYGAGMSNIDVQERAETDAGWEYEVIVHNKSDETVHLVTVPRDYYEELTGGVIKPEALVQKSFMFLLEREPKEAILSSFELPLISEYFPEYETEIVAT